MYAVFLCSLFVCAHEPYAAFTRIEPCKATAQILKQRVPKDFWAVPVCFSPEQAKRRIML